MKPLRRPVSCGVDEETARPIGWSLPSGCFIADSPVRQWAAGGEAGAGAKYGKAPGFRDLIQTALSWIDSPCSGIRPQSDAAEPPCAEIAARGGSPTP